MVRRSLLSGFLLLILLSGCSGLEPGTPAPAPARPLGPGERWLPVADWTVDGVRLLCGGTGLLGGFLLHGSPTDPRSAWMVVPDGSRRELAWPVGYSARFVPGLEILDDSERVIAREGSTIDGGCETPEPDVWWVQFASELPP